MSIFKRDKEAEKPKDKDQEEYRKFFGITDKFLIQYEIDGEGDNTTGYIVFIDDELDIDWKDYRPDKFWEGDERQTRDKWIAKLNAVESRPCTNLSRDDKLEFKKLIGSGYLLALQKQFEDIPEVIKQSVTFVEARNNEVSRKLFLQSSSIVALFVLLSWGYNAIYYGWELEWYNGIVMGVLGAYVSIWMRYGRMEFTGLSSKYLHYMEATSRLLIGAIFSIVAICAVKCGLILSHEGPELQKFSFAIIGFVSGFSERFVPSLVEKFVDEQIVSSKVSQQLEDIKNYCCPVNEKKS